MTIYRGYCINLDLVGEDLHRVFIDGANWSQTVAGEENAVERGREYVDEVIAFKEHEDAPERPNRREE